MGGLLPTQLYLNFSMSPSPFQVCATSTPGMTFEAPGLGAGKAMKPSYS